MLNTVTVRYHKSISKIIVETTDTCMFQNDHIWNKIENKGHWNENIFNHYSVIGHNINLNLSMYFVSIYATKTVWLPQI